MKGGIHTAFGRLKDAEMALCAGAYQLSSALGDHHYLTRQVAGMWRTIREWTFPEAKVHFLPHPNTNLSGCGVWQAMVASPHRVDVTCQKCMRFIHWADSMGYCTKAEEATGCEGS